MRQVRNAAQAAVCDDVLALLRLFQQNSQTLYVACTHAQAAVCDDVLALLRAPTTAPGSLPMVRGQGSGLGLGFRV